MPPNEADDPPEPKPGCSDPEAFTSFFKEHHRGVFQTLLVVAKGDHAAADDATSEGFARAYTEWDHTVAQHPAPVKWVARVAINHYRSERRAWTQRLAGTPPREGAYWDPEPWLDGPEVAAVSQLPPRQRQVLALRDLQDLSTADTAEVLGLAEGTVRALLWRAHSTLRQLLSMPQQEDPNE